MLANHPITWKILKKIEYNKTREMDSTHIAINLTNRHPNLSINGPIITDGISNKIIPNVNAF